MLDDCEDDTLLHMHLEESKVKPEAHYQANYAKLISVPITAQSSISSISAHSAQKIDFTSCYNKFTHLNTDEIDKFSNCQQKASLQTPFNGGLGVGVVLMVLEQVTQSEAAEARRGGSFFMSSYKQGIYLLCGMRMCHMMSGHYLLLQVPIFKQSSVPAASCFLIQP